MAKAKTAFVCNDCGADFPKWQGQCGECQAWNTLSEVRLSAPAARAANARVAGRSGYAGTVAAVQRLEEVAVVDLPRLASGFDELDRVLGGDDLAVWIEYFVAGAGHCVKAVQVGACGDVPTNRAAVPPKRRHESDGRDGWMADTTQ